jgi:AraC family transcriptional regulator, regulatory protein of adaptative response / methylated-DNA-[protein]-cysteine methyltransferase
MLPPIDVMRRAFARKDSAFDGIFFVAIKTTGIFCRPVCKSRTPRPENVDFFASAEEARRAGFRPCKRCRPVEAASGPPAAVQRALALLDRDPEGRVTDAALQASGMDPSTLRRQFRLFCGVTFHQYQRARRLGAAVGTLQDGGSVIDAQLEGGYDSGSGFRAAFAKLFGDAPKVRRMAGASDERLVASRIESPLGPMVAVASRRGICLYDFMDRKGLASALGRLCESARSPVVPGECDVLRQVALEMAEYFAGKRKRFGVALDIRAGTEFQKRAWEFLRSIPYGETRTYGAQARALGQPGAVRAVGSANGMNYLAILIPCHRVVGAGGALTGYGGGLPRKRWLIDHEAEFGS